MKRIIFSVFLASIVCSLFGQDFEVSPVAVNFTAEPGENQVRKINIINHSPRPQKYQFKINDFLLDTDGVVRPMALGINKRSCAEWLTLNPSFIELGPNQSATVDMIITVPKDGFTARWANVGVEPVKEQNAFEADKNLSQGVLIVPRISIQVRQSPRSNRSYKASINNLREITKPTDTNRVFEVMVQNSGDNILSANVHLILANVNSGDEQKFEATNFSIYPDGKRLLKLHVPRNIAKGKYALAAILDYGHRQPLEGTQLMIDF